MNPRSLAIFIALLLAAYVGAQWLGVELRAREATVSGIASAIDGDTIRIGMERVRLSGIDAPEMTQPCYVEGIRCGEMARAVLAELLSRGLATCAVEGRDRYKRIVATCSVPGVADIGERMVATGYAMDWPRYDASCRYCAAMNDAAIERRGLWVTSDFTPPWDWRHGNAAKARWSAK